MVRLYELINEYEWLDIVPAMGGVLVNDETFERNLAGHGVVFGELKTLTPVIKDDMRIIVEWTVDNYDGQPYVDVFGLEWQENDIGESDPVRWGLDFVPWQEWLGMEIDEDILIPFTEQEIIAHCLWEMTFYGFSQETIQSTMAEMKQSADDIKAGKIKGETFDSIEDFFASLPDRISDDC